MRAISTTVFLERVRDSLGNEANMRLSEQYVRPIIGENVGEKRGLLYLFLDFFSISNVGMTANFQLSRKFSELHDLDPTNKKIKILKHAFEMVKNAVLFLEQRFDQVDAEIDKKTFFLRLRKDLLAIIADRKCPERWRFSAIHFLVIASERLTSAEKATEDLSNESHAKSLPKIDKVVKELMPVLKKITGIDSPVDMDSQLIQKFNGSRGDLEKKLKKILHNKKCKINQRKAAAQMLVAGSHINFSTKEKMTESLFSPISIEDVKDCVVPANTCDIQFS